MTSGADLGRLVCGVMWAGMGACVGFVLGGIFGMGLVPFWIDSGPDDPPFQSLEARIWLSLASAVVGGFLFSALAAHFFREQLKRESAAQHGAAADDLPQVVYNGVEMVEGWPERIQEAQAILTVSVAGTEYPRVRYGEEAEDWGADRGPCHDCAVLKGQQHVPSCDVERCPACGGQMIGCDCDSDETDVGPT